MDCPFCGVNPDCAAHHPGCSSQLRTEGDQLRIELTQAKERIGELEAIVRGQDAVINGNRHDAIAQARLVPQLERAEAKVTELEAQLAKANARVKDYESARQGWQERAECAEERHRIYFEDIGKAIGEKRKRRHTGEPAQSDAREVQAMRAKVIELEGERDRDQELLGMGKKTVRDLRAELESLRAELADLKRKPFWEDGQQCPDCREHQMVCRCAGDDDAR